MAVSERPAKIQISLGIRQVWWAFSRDLTMPHLDLLHFALWIMGNDITLVPFNSRAPVVIEFVVKISKSLIFESLPFLY